MEVQRRCRIMGMEDKVSSKYRGRQAQWRRCGTTGMDTAAEDMRDRNRRYVGRRRLQNGLEGRRRAEQISTRDDYKPDGVTPL